MSVLVLDIAFANMGWSVIEGGNVVAFGTIRTEKSKKKTVRVSDDRATRAALLAEELNQIIVGHKPKGILGELPSGAQNAAAATSMAYAAGVVVGVATSHGLPCEWISEGDSKKAAIGKRTGTKEEMMDWARSAHPGVVFPSAKCHFEHVADSLAAYNGLKHGVLARAFG